jgi:hypothetical protein
VPGPNQPQRYEDVWRSGGIAPPFLTTALGPFNQKKSPRYPLDRRLGASQSQSGRYGFTMCLLLILGIEPVSLESGSPYGSRMKMDGGSS